MFPLKKYRHILPNSFESSGGFGYSQKNGIHQTGIELYCEDGQEVFAIEDSDVVDMFISTGKSTGSPWFQNTYTILLEGNNGVINYSCVVINPSVQFGKQVKEGQLIGKVKKLMDISIPTLHIELYDNGVEEPIVWKCGEKKPIGLVDPIGMLEYELNKY